MKSLVRIILLYGILLSVSSCVRERMAYSEEIAVDRILVTKSSAVDSITSYTRLANPYSMSNMVATLRAHNMSTNIQPTDLYVCFKIQTKEQYDILEKDYNLELFEYPLDIELEEGEEYINPDLPETDLIWLYTTVPVGFQFPSGIPFQVIQACYIPDDDFYVETSGHIRQTLEIAAFEHAGMAIPPSEEIARSSWTTPRGYITVQVDSLGVQPPLPVQGIKVRTHTIVRWATTYTDANGYYEMDKKFVFNPFYSYDLKSVKGFEIHKMNSILCTSTHTLGAHNRNGYNYEIQRSNAGQWCAAIVNNAAYEYYEKCVRDGMTLPPDNLSIWITTLMGKSAAPLLDKIDRREEFLKENNINSLNDFLISIAVLPLNGLRAELGLCFPDVLIGFDEDYQNLYYCTCHELSHASHYSQVGDGFWSQYIRYILNYGDFTGDSYGDGSGEGADYCEIGEMWGYAMGEMLAEEKYPGYITVRKGGFSENVGVGDWIHPKLFVDLTMNSPGFTKAEILECLTPDVTNSDQLYLSLSYKRPDLSAFIAQQFQHNNIVRKYKFPDLYDVVIEDQYVTSPRIIQGDNIMLNNVHIYDDVSIEATGEVVVNNPFYIALGSTFTIDF